MGATTTETVGIAPVALGLPVPPFTPHAISVSLPTWRDNVGYEAGDRRVLDTMVCGYPRFFIGFGIRKLAQICIQKFGVYGESAMLFPTQKTADACRSFILSRSALEGAAVQARLIQLLICPEDKANKTILVNSEDCDCNGSASLLDLHIVLFPSEAFSVAMQFWQHSGAGISSRLAEQCLSLLPEGSPTSSPTPPPARGISFKSSHKHYGAKEALRISPSKVAEDLNADHSVYLEERYGRNLPIAAAAAAKRALRRRIAGGLLRDDTDHVITRDQSPPLGPSARGVSNVSENDVYLYPSGMNAIWNAHQLALATRPVGKSVCFGFPYADTLKILEKWGPGCHFLGHGLDSDIDQLELILEEEYTLNPSKPPILALFTEFPSNPLLRSADLVRLRALADKYDFLIVVDETIGNFMNVEVLPFADIVVCSLTKVFSGSSNVMGGSLVLNPMGRHYTTLKSHMDSNYEDTYFDQDAIFMERNSRDFQRRVRIIDHNTEAICDFLYAHSRIAGAPNAVIKDVAYPKYTTPQHYEARRVKANTEVGVQQGGYGGLFSVTFTSAPASHAFFDALPCYKGPSLGTNFTLASPFTILAHFKELDWAAQYGVDTDLIRVSVGLEDTKELLAGFDLALRAAETAAETL
ncbi:pyridoxal phosphate-dependent transferase [Lentinula aciculospora]|uniref:cystathionine gamma-synthase n=1 Tax=Lentinula aciculospora TaxID=153920 RepID=A0A9W9AVS1_9AGAR|nr:pyridoxal phosphate-dependent transferase [Lentinula aciculospora]